MTISTKNAIACVEAAKLKGAEFSNLEVCVLTDKDEFKVFPCRSCRRPCIVNRFAAPAKTECTFCREAGDSPTKMREFDRSLEPHTLTDKEETKEVPCRSCGRPCIVSKVATPAKTACNTCRGSVATPKRKVSLEKDKDGRYHEEVVLEGPGDIQWTQWTIGSPMDVERIYLPDERAEFEAVRAASLEAGREAKKAKAARHAAESRLADIPDKPRKVDKKEAKEEKKRLDIERQKAEDEVSEADQLEVQQLDLRKTNQERSTELARIAYIRGALTNRYRVEERDGRRWLVRGEREVAIPDDFLNAEGYAIAQKPFKLNPAHAAIYAGMLAQDLEIKANA